MRFLKVLIAVVLCFEGVATAAVDVPTTGPSPVLRPVGRAAIAGCEDFVVQPQPLSPRPRIRLAGYTPGKPHRMAPHRVRHPVKHHAIKKRVKRRAIHRHPVRKRRVLAHRPVSAVRPVAQRPRPSGSRPALQRVTYAAPLCGERTQEINDLLGLDQPIVAAAAPVGPVQNTNFDIGPVTGTNNIPGFPVTGGPDIFPGVPGTPGGPPIVTPPPPPVIPVPEPETWVTIIAGLLATGLMLRRRRRSRAEQHIA